MTRHQAPRFTQKVNIDIVKHGVDTNQELTPLKSTVFLPHVIMLRAVVAEQSMEHHAAHRVDERWSPRPTSCAASGQAVGMGRGIVGCAWGR